MKPLNRRTFLVSLGAGASVGYLTPINSFAQSSNFNLSREDYLSIHQAKVQLRLAYSYFCLSPDEYRERLAGELDSTQEILDGIISIDYQQLPDLVEEEPWTLTNLPPTAIQLIRQLNDMKSDPAEQIEYDPCTEATVKIIADVIGIETQQLNQLKLLLEEIENSGVEIFTSLREIAYSVIDLDLHRAKTHTEIVLNILTSEETYNLISMTMQSGAFRTLISWLVKRKVPVFGIASLIASLLLALYDHQDDLQRCLSDN